VQEDKRGDDKTTYETIKCAAGLDLVRNTRMFALCGPARRSIPGGLLTRAIRTTGEEKWEGSRTTFFAMNEGGVTLPHADTQMVHGVDLLLPAAGTMRSVLRREDGPAKRALIVCSHDLENVQRVLDLRLKEKSASQYKGGLRTLEEFASELRKEGIRFCIVDYPADCSYFIPAGCAHAFVTCRLVESAVWHACLEGSYPSVDGEV